MSDEIFLEGKNYTSSKKAAAESGYAQDYIGQLARSGAIDAQRVGGLWYVSMESLAGYQRNAASYVPIQPVKAARDLDSVVSFDGKEYISASKAAKVTGYNQDYVGQLARSGKILSRQIGNRWYVERAGIVSHKAEKDRLLAAVQAESVGISRPVAPETAPVRPDEPLLSYFPDESPLLPLLTRAVERQERTAEPSSRPIPIRVVSREQVQPVGPSEAASRDLAHGTRRNRSLSKIMTGAGIALTFVLVLSYGLVSLKEGSVYTMNIQKAATRINSDGLVGGAGNIFEEVTARIERWLVPELTYTRPANQ